MGFITTGMLLCPSLSVYLVVCLFVSLSIYLFVYVCMYVCVCVGELYLFNFQLPSLLMNMHIYH